MAAVAQASEVGRKRLGLVGGVPGVQRRGEGGKLLLRVIRHVQRIHEHLERMLVHRLPASERLELLVGLLDTIAPHDRLDWLRKHLPRRVQVTGHLFQVCFQLAYALQRRLVCQQAVAQADAQVPQHRGICKVTLPAADGQLVAKVVQQCVGDTQVAFRVLKVDWVHFVGHSAGANLSRHRLLLEIANRDVAPHVTVKVYQDVVEARHRREELRNVVVRLYLCRVWVVLEPE
mmetsp:Transcript_12694/g.44075  ORF Transcript_12694/g.44075 Transcript_12694/m.44075 type:complete len:232 (+) Transcript_12694:834-1529(+)